MSRFRPFEFNDSEDKPWNNWIGRFVLLARLLVGLAIVGIIVWTFLYELAKGIAGK